MCVVVSLFSFSSYNLMSSAIQVWCYSEVHLLFGPELVAIAVIQHLSTLVGVWEGFVCADTGCKTAEDMPHILKNNTQAQSRLPMC